MPHIQIKCPCGQLLQVGADAAGKTVRCPKCSQLLRVPGAAAPQPQQAAAAPAAPRPPAVTPPAPPAPRPAVAATPAPAQPPPPPPRPALKAAPKPAPPPPAEKPAEPPRQDDADPDLGPLVREYRPRRWSRRLAFAAGFLAVAVVLSIIGESMKEVSYRAHEPGMPVERVVKHRIKRGFRNIFNFSVFIGLGATLYYSLWTLRTWNLKVDVHENGFRYQRWRRRATCLWTEVDGVYYLKQRQRLLFSWTTRYCQVIKADGEGILLPSPINHLVAGLASSSELQQLQLVYQIIVHTLLRTPLPDMEELCATIRRKSTEVLLPRIVKALDLGERVPMGPSFEISAQELTYAEASLPWSQIERIEVGGGVGITSGLIRIRQRGAEGWWAQIPSGLTGNRDALLEIAKRRYGIDVETFDQDDIRLRLKERV